MELQNARLAAGAVVAAGLGIAGMTVKHAFDCGAKAVHAAARAASHLEQVDVSKQAWRIGKFTRRAAEWTAKSADYDTRMTVCLGAAAILTVGALIGGYYLYSNLSSRNVTKQPV